MKERMELPDGFIDRVLSRCTECGDCLVWTGAAVNGRDPVISVLGQVRPVRRMLWQALGREVTKGRSLAAGCNNPMCVSPDHAEERRRGRAVGTRLRPDHRANIARARRRMSVLTWDDVLEIRASDKPDSEIAAEKGIGESMANKIRRGQYWRDLESPFRAML